MQWLAKLNGQSETVQHAEPPPPTGPPTSAIGADTMQKSAQQPNRAESFWGFSFQIAFFSFYPHLSDFWFEPNWTAPKN